MRKWSVLFTLVLFSLGLTGCAATTYIAKIANPADVYTLPRIQGAPKILIADLVDHRGDKRVGKISLLNLKTETDVNIILTNRIAKKLRDESFNVQKIELAKELNKEEILESLAAENGKIFLSGGLDGFFIESFDAVLDKAHGDVSFYIQIFDQKGKEIFKKTYSGRAERYVGLTGGFGSRKLIEDCVQSSIDELFKDKEFNKFLKEIKK